MPHRLSNTDPIMEKVFPADGPIYDKRIVRLGILGNSKLSQRHSK